MRSTESFIKSVKAKLYVTVSFNLSKKWTMKRGEVVS